MTAAPTADDLRQFYLYRIRLPTDNPMQSIRSLQSRCWRATRGTRYSDSGKWTREILGTQVPLLDITDPCINMELDFVSVLLDGGPRYELCTCIALCARLSKMIRATDESQSGNIPSALLLGKRRMSIVWDKIMRNCSDAYRRQYC